MLTGLRNMPRTVWLIGAISLVNDSASEMLYPLIPLYLSSAEWCGLATLRHASCLQQIPLHGGALLSGKLIQSIFAAPS